MGRRRKAREAAVQCLYGWDVTGRDPAAVLAGYWESTGAADPEVKLFAERLVHGVVARAEEIDAMISDQTSHWRMERLGLVEKSILRLGAFELMADGEPPPAVVIDEAVELAKRFGGPESVPFVNGVLDGIKRRIADSVSET